MRRRRQGGHRDGSVRPLPHPLRSAAQRRPVAGACLHRGRAPEARARGAAGARALDGGRGVAHGRLSCPRKRDPVTAGQYLPASAGLQIAGSCRTRSRTCPSDQTVQAGAGAAEPGRRRYRRQCRRRPRGPRARAEAKGADLIAFTELFLTGYPIEDLVLKPAFSARRARPARSLRAIPATAAPPC